MSAKTSHYKIVLFGVKTDTYDLYCKFKDDIDLVVTLNSNEMDNYKISGGKNIKTLFIKYYLYSQRNRNYPSLQR